MSPGPAHDLFLQSNIPTDCPSPGSDITNQAVHVYPNSPLLYSSPNSGIPRTSRAKMQISCTTLATCIAEKHLTLSILPHCSIITRWEKAACPDDCPNDHHCLHHPSLPPKYCRNIWDTMKVKKAHNRQRKKGERRRNTSSKEDAEVTETKRIKWKEKLPQNW